MHACKTTSSYIAQYPVLGTVQGALHFTSLTDLFTQTPSTLLWEASSHMLQLMREGCSYAYPPLSIARYSFIQLNWSNVEGKTCPRFQHRSTEFKPGFSYSRVRTSTPEPLRSTACVCRIKQFKDINLLLSFQSRNNYVHPTLPHSAISMNTWL